MEGQPPVVSISLEIDNRLKVTICPEICSECSGAKEPDFPGPIFARIGFILSRPNSIGGATSLQNATLDDDFPSFGSDLHDLDPHFGAQKSTYREEYGFSSSDNQGEPVGNLIKGPNESHKNHSALSGEQYIDVQGVAGLGLNSAIEAPKVPYSEEAGPMDNDNDDESIGNTIRGTNVSQLGHSERSAQEDNAYMTAADNSHNRQILARMEKILWECKSIDQLIAATTKMTDGLLEIPGVQRAICKRSQSIAMQTQAYDQCVVNMIDEVEFEDEFEDCDEWTEEMAAMANGQMLAAMFLSAQLAQDSNSVPDGVLMYPEDLESAECANPGNIQIAEKTEISDFRLAL
jgi:hypothetical protein